MNAPVWTIRLAVARYDGAALRVAAPTLDAAVAEALRRADEEERWADTGDGGEPFVAEIRLETAAEPLPVPERFAERVPVPERHRERGAPPAVALSP